MYIVFKIEIILKSMIESFLTQFTSKDGRHRRGLYLKQYFMECVNRWYTITASSGPFYLHGLTLIPAWISNYMPGEVWGEIIDPFLNFNGCTVEV